MSIIDAMVGIGAAHIQSPEHIAVVDAPDLDALVERRAHDSTRAGIHAGAVAAARHHCNTFQHVYIPLVYG